VEAAADTGDVNITGKAGVNVKAISGDVKVDGGPNVLINTG